jgi:hypothetical protein
VLWVVAVRIWLHTAGLSRQRPEQMSISGMRSPWMQKTEQNACASAAIRIVAMVKAIKVISDIRSTRVED